MVELHKSLAAVTDVGGEMSLIGGLLSLSSSTKMLEAVSWHIAVTLLLLLLVLMAFQLQRRQKQHQVLEKEAKGLRNGRNEKDLRKESKGQHVHVGDQDWHVWQDRANQDVEEEEVAEELPNHPHLQGCFVPYSGDFLHFPNKDLKQYSYSNEMCEGSTLTVHRATYDPALDRSGDYPFSEVFKGRKINWEVRVQMRFKQTPDGTLKFGIELDDYVPMIRATKVAMRAVVGSLKYIVGNDLHHSPGDDPAETVGEAERPIFSMPIWAFDQFIETPEGEQPPMLNDPNFMNMGIKRADDVKAYARTMDNLKFKVGPTYTFSFWSISTLIDNVMWRIGGVIPGVTIDFNQFCGRPPVHLVIYTLRPAADGKDERHLDSRKCYLFHLAFWSSLSQPPSHRLRQLLPRKSVAAAERSPMASSSTCVSPRGSKSPAALLGSGLQGAALRAGPTKRQGRMSDALLSCFEGLRPCRAPVSCLPKRG